MFVWTIISTVFLILFIFAVYHRCVKSTSSSNIKRNHGNEQDNGSELAVGDVKGKSIMTSSMQNSVNNSVNHLRKRMGFQLPSEANGHGEGGRLNKTQCLSKTLAASPWIRSKDVIQKIIHLQASIRGYLIRKAFVNVEKQVEAAVVIQRWWRYMVRNSSSVKTVQRRYSSSDRSDVSWSTEATDNPYERTSGSDCPSSDASSPSSLLSLCPNIRESDLLFGDLLTVCCQDSPILFSEILDRSEFEGCVKVCEGTHSDIFRIYGSHGTSILKIVNIEYLIKYWDSLYSGAVISLELTKLKEVLDCYTTGFTETRGVCCVHDRYPPELMKAWKDYIFWRRSDHITGPKDMEVSQPYVVFHMSYAGLPLSQVKVENALQLRSILQQVALSLAVAETACEFEHRDLSLNHILLKQTHLYLSQYSIKGKTFFVNTWGIKARIIDFASSRLIKDGRVVYTNLNSFSSYDSRLNTVCKEMADIVKGDWQGFYPSTNVLCLFHMISLLEKIYQRKFSKRQDKQESEAWLDISMWKKNLPMYGSMSEFVFAEIQSSSS